MIKVDILGTCYTRELFNTARNYVVNTYLMQLSIFTMFSDPFLIEESDTKCRGNHNFKRRMICYEFNKQWIQRLLESSAEYLIIDLADVGRSILEFDNPANVKIVSTQDILLTLAHLKEREEYSEISMKTIDAENYTDSELEQYLINFIKLILGKYDENHIILNRVQMQKVYYDDNSEQQIDNRFPYTKWHFIKKIERMFLQLLPNCKVLSSRYEPLLDVHHRFGGPHPMHFESIYYEYRMNLLDALLNNTSSSSSIDNAYMRVYEEKIEDIKLKKVMKSSI